MDSGTLAPVHVDHKADLETRMLSRKFSRKACHLVLSYYGDEGSTDKFRAYSVRLDPALPLTAENLHAAAGFKPEVKLEERSADEFFTAMKDPDTVGEENLAQYGKLEASMRQNLTDLKVFLDANEEMVQGKVYIVGRSPTMNVCGLQATRIWT